MLVPVLFAVIPTFPLFFGIYLIFSKGAVTINVGNRLICSGQGAVTGGWIMIGGTFVYFASIIVYILVDNPLPIVIGANASIFSILAAQIVACKIDVK